MDERSNVWNRALRPPLRPDRRWALALLWPPARRRRRDRQARLGALLEVYELVERYERFWTGPAGTWHPLTPKIRKLIEETEVGR